MKAERRSGCPINLTMEVLGDRWSLIIIRDMMFGRRRHFREMLTRSEEGIASNILAARLKHLIDLGLLTRRNDPTHKQKAIYSLTETSIQLLPLIATMGGWGRRHLPVTEELSVRARLLEEGGPPLWDAFMDELRCLHLGDGEDVAGDEPSVLGRLDAAYREAVTRAAVAATPERAAPVD